VRLPLHVLVHLYGHLQGACEQYFVQLLNWILLIYVCCVFVQYAAVCHYRRFVCVSGAPVRVRSGHSVTRSDPFVCVSGAPVRVRSGHRMTRSDPDRSSRHTYKPTVYINGIQSSNCTKYCSRAPWRWSYIWTKTCRGNLTKMFLTCF